MFSFKNIIIRPINEDRDLKVLYNWRLKDDWNFIFYSKSIPSWEEFLTEYKNERDTWKFLQLVACEKDSDIPLGIGYLHDINLFNRNGFFDIYVDEKYRKTSASIVLSVFILIYAFEKLNLNKIYCDVYDFNSNSLDVLVHKNWFNEEGYFKEHILFNSKFVDVRRFAIYKNKLGNLKKLIKYDILK